ncbi:MAG: MGMT family protein [Patescibacteria group bacterium]|jgi:methylated-DNA-[protein]-cysteine S-methyltransferase
MDFRDRVYKIIKQIPAGKVATYSQIGQKLGNRRLARAVGAALKNNKNSFVICRDRKIAVPCHRVVCATGKIGGFNEGLKKKRLLLQKEGVKVFGGRIDLKTFGW